MHKQMAAVLALVISTLSWASDTPQSYEDAKAVWQQHKSEPNYQKYVSEFTLFNDHFHLTRRAVAIRWRQAP